MKRKVLLSASILLIVLIVSVTLIVYFPLTATSTSEPFYVGVTFGGDNAADARQLIDKVKSYTTLFILQSGSCKEILLQLMKSATTPSSQDCILRFT